MCAGILLPTICRKHCSVAANWAAHSCHPYFHNTTAALAQQFNQSEGNIWPLNMKREPSIVTNIVHNLLVTLLYKGCLSDNSEYNLHIQAGTRAYETYMYGFYMWNTKRP